MATRKTTATTRKRTAKDAPAETAQSPGQEPSPTPLKTTSTPGPRAKVRMYRQGLGDCFLLTLPRNDGAPYYIVIDCGVILGTADPQTIMAKVVQDIIDTTHGHIDLMVATHEHWDHLSGLVQAKELWQKLHVDQVWVGWTEDPNDKLGQQLRGERQALVAALTMAANRLRMAGSSDSAEEVAGMLEFFGATGGASTKDALEVVKSLSSNVRFCIPQDDPVILPGTGVKVYVLGPPHDLTLAEEVKSVGQGWGNLRYRRGQRVPERSDARDGRRRLKRAVWGRLSDPIGCRQADAFFPGLLLGRRR